MQLYSADDTIKKLPMKTALNQVAYNRPNFFFSTIANRPKVSPNTIFCFIKMASCATSILWTQDQYAKKKEFSLLLVQL